MTSDRQLDLAAARLGLPRRRLEAALDAVAADRARARLRDAGRQHSLISAVRAAARRR